MMIASAVVVALLALVAALALARLPAGAELAIHWNAAGEADGFAGAAKALFMPVMLAAGISLLLVALPAIEPLQHQLEQSATLYRTAWAATLAIMALVEFTIAAPAFGITPPRMLHIAAMGIVFIVIGNVLPKSRPGFFVGIRTPWTLTDRDNWIATHRFGAWTTIAAGLVLLVSAVVPVPPQARLWVTLGAVALAVVPPIVFSWWYWQRRRTA
jgi:uncharacterized membrane protein